MQCECTILSFLVCLATRYFSTLYREWYDVRGGGRAIEHEKCVSIFSTAFVWNIAHPRKTSARYDEEIPIRLQTKYLLSLSHFNEIWIFSTDFRKMLKYQTSRKFAQQDPSVSCGRTDGQIAMSKPVDASRNVANAPKEADTCCWRIR